MSQHLFTAQYDGKAVEVLMGWDRPLQGFFLVVEEVGNQSDEYIYTNMEDPDLVPWMGLPPTLEPLLAKLQQFGITVPAQMLEEIKTDAWGNVGNRNVTYDASGEITN